MNTNNIILKTDSYKLGHFPMYDEDGANINSYFESRNGAKFPYTVFSGLQILLIKHFVGQVITKEKIDAAEPLILAHMGPNNFNREAWELIVNEYDGKLPIVIEAVEEGTPVPVSNVLLQVRVKAKNKEHGKKLKFLVNYFETLLTHVWSASTVATLSRTTKEIIVSYLNRTTDHTPETIAAIAQFALHDFGYRGVSSDESAGFEGQGHLINFLGTDTVIALVYAIEYYGANANTLAFSVRATEHSIMTQRGEKGEFGLLKDLIKQNNEGILSVVSDSYDIQRFVDVYLRNLRMEILSRKPNAIGLCKFVVRPDSLRFKGDTPESQMVWILEKLYDIFGGKVNSKGYKVLNPKLGLLWGDGIDQEGIEKILGAVSAAGYSTECLVFGMGGGLLQKINRDTQRSAFKCSAREVNDAWEDVYKKPLDESKASKKGVLALIKEDGQFKTILHKDLNGRKNHLKVVFDNGELVNPITFDKVRENAKL